ncbi:MAG: tetratricopeptide repeat protein [Treponema sp.]
MKRFYLFVFVLLLFSCKNEVSDSSLFGAYEDVSDRMRHLIEVLKEAKDEDVVFAIRKEMAKELKISGQNKRLIVFLTSIIEAPSFNKYTDYFLLMLANEYMEMKMPEIASYYFERIIASDADLIVKDKSLKLLSLNSLIKNTETPEKLIHYYSLLIRDFYEDINMPYSLFMLARSYERMGEWNMAIQTYSKFLNLKEFDIVIPGIPDSYSYAKKIVDYSSSSKDWTSETLEELVEVIKYAIKTRNYALLEKYRSKVNFFAMSWKQEVSEAKTDYTIYNLMYAGDIQISKTVDSSSTPYEAYLRTSGWTHYLKTWYFYLKKINFPADPSIHGRWEWAGIYYGEKL